MASEVSIINEALRLIGETTINARADQVKAARIADSSFDEHRDFVLGQHTWRFARERVELSASSTAPAWGFDNAYPLPSDCIAPVLVNNEHAVIGKWQEESGSILTDLSAPLQILYIKRVIDVSLMTAEFRQVLSTYMAAKWADPIRGSREKADEMAQTYRKILDEARTTDSRKGTEEVIDSTEWLEARLGRSPKRRESEFGFTPGTF